MGIFFLILTPFKYKVNIKLKEVPPHGGEQDDAASASTARKKRRGNRAAATTNQFQNMFDRINH